MIARARRNLVLLLTPASLVGVCMALAAVNTLSGFQDALKTQATVVGNLNTAQTQVTALVSSSQGATGALQATQAGNQLLAMVSQQLADVIALLAAQGRAQSLQGAQMAAGQNQGQVQLQRFLMPGPGYQPNAVTMFHN